MNKNISIGLKREIQESLDFHDSENKEMIPFLISSKFLRSLGCGQIDLARWELKNKKYFINILEVKGSSGVSDHQLKRLAKSANFIGELLDMMVIINCNNKASIF